MIDLSSRMRAGFALALSLAVAFGLSAPAKSQTTPSVAASATPTPPWRNTDPAAGTWGRRAAMIRSNSEMSNTQLDGKIYSVSGYPITRIDSPEAEVYDPEKNAWSMIAPFPFPVNHSVSVGYAGKIYTIGGQPNNNLTGPFAANVWMYDTATNAWSQRAPMPTPRSAMAVALLDGKIYVSGGRPPHGSDFAVYDPQLNTWETLPDMPTARNHHTSAAVNGKIYVIGGRPDPGYTGPKLDAVDIYDPATRRWSKGAPMPTPRGGVTGVLALGCIHVMGGEGNVKDARGVYPQHEIYHPKTNTWTTSVPLPIPIHGTIGGAFVGGLVYVIGGEITESADSPTTILQVYRPTAAESCE